MEKQQVQHTLATIHGAETAQLVSKTNQGATVRSGERHDIGLPQPHRSASRENLSLYNTLWDKLSARHECAPPQHHPV